MKLLLVAASLQLAAQQQIPFPEEGRPRLLKADILQGSVTVRGYAGKDAIIDAGSGLSVTAQNNVIALTGGVRRSGAVTIQVPHQTSLQLRCTNCGDLRVEGVEGDIDVNTVNGGIHLLNVSGSVLAHSLNKGITAVIGGVDPNKSMSFSSLNGDIDCTFPAGLKANVKMRTTNGKIYTDFDIRLAGGEAIRMDRGISGTINGGGAEILFKAFNGSINIRKK